MIRKNSLKVSREVVRQVNLISDSNQIIIILINFGNFELVSPLLILISVHNNNNVCKNTAKYNNINTIFTSSNGEDVIDNNFILIYLVD